MEDPKTSTVEDRAEPACDRLRQVFYFYTNYSRPEYWPKDWHLFADDLLSEAILVMRGTLEHD